MQIKRFTLEDNLKEFIKFPFSLYKNTPYQQFWVPPLISDQKKLFSKNHPFFAHAKAEFFIAYEKGRPVGRIAAIIDYNHIEFHNEKCGFFGYFECINSKEVAIALIDEVKKYLRLEGMSAVRGPFNPSTNEEVGFLLEGFDSPPSIMMPYTPPYYLNLMELAGLKKVKDLFAYIRTVKEPLPERIGRIVDRVKKKERLILRCFDMKNFKKEVEIFKKIYNSAWEANWGFVPMTDGEIDYMAKTLGSLIDFRLAHFIEVDGNPVGATLCVPDYNFVLKRLNGRLGPIEIIKFLYLKQKIKKVRLMTLGVIKEYRNRGLEAVLYYEILKATGAAGYDCGELSWTLEDNDLINKGIEAMGCRLYKKYRIFEAAL